MENTRTLLKAAHKELAGLMGGRARMARRKRLRAALEAGVMVRTRKGAEVAFALSPIDSVIHAIELIKLGEAVPDAAVQRLRAAFGAAPGRPQVAEVVRRAMDGAGVAAAARDAFLQAIDLGVEPAESPPAAGLDAARRRRGRA